MSANDRGIGKVDESPSKDLIPDEFYEGLFEVARAIVSAQNATSDRPAFTDEVRMVLGRRDGHKGLLPEEAALLLKSIYEPEANESRAVIVAAARNLRTKLFSNKFSTMVPIEISSFCSSDCSFCGWASQNKEVPRLKINSMGLLAQLDLAIKKGYSHIELVAADDLNFLRGGLDEAVRVTRERIDQLAPSTRISICLTPLPLSCYERLSSLGVDTVLTWQETYDQSLYNAKITIGPKAYGLTEKLTLCKEKQGYLQRIKSHESVVRSGLQAGMGVMLGLGEPMTDALALIIHMQALIRRYHGTIKPIIIGMPTLNSTTTDLSEEVISGKAAFDVEKNFELISAIYLLSLPDYFAWVFPNCRVPLKTQIDSLQTAGCFTSTSVRVGPGSYLLEVSAGGGFEQYFSKTNTQNASLDWDTILKGEQFRHHYFSHEVYLAALREKGLVPASDQWLLARSRDLSC